MAIREKDVRCQYLWMLCQSNFGQDTWCSLHTSCLKYCLAHSQNLLNFLVILMGHFSMYLVLLRSNTLSPFIFENIWGSKSPCRSYSWTITQINIFRSSDLFFFFFLNQLFLWLTPKARISKMCPSGWQSRASRHSFTLRLASQSHCPMWPFWPGNVGITDPRWTTGWGADGRPVKPFFTLNTVVPTFVPSWADRAAKHGWMI